MDVPSSGRAPGRGFQDFSVRDFRISPSNDDGFLPGLSHGVLHAGQWSGLLCETRDFTEISQYISAEYPNRYLWPVKSGLTYYFEDLPINKHRQPDIRLSISPVCYLLNLKCCSSCSEKPWKAACQLVDSQALEDH